MKRKMLVLVFVAVLLSTGPPLVPKVKAAPSNEVIAQRCVLAQAYASSELKQNDLRARVNRLQIYEYIHQRLDILAKRLEYNQQAGAKQYRNTLDEYLKKIEVFKQNYEDYDSAREAFSGLPDCKKNPDQFKKALTDLRKKRTTIEKTTAAISEFLEQEVTTQLMKIQANVAPA